MANIKKVSHLQNILKNKKLSAYLYEILPCLKGSGKIEKPGKDLSPVRHAGKNHNVHSKETKYCPKRSDIPA